MRAIAIDDFGAAPALIDLPVPEPGPGEVRVRVHASSVNGFDAAVAGGYLKGMMEHRFPVVLGKDFAGTVDALGEGAARFAVGDAVYGVVMKPFLGDGAFGEYVVVGEAYGITRFPDGLDLATAGTLGLAGAAALGAVGAVAAQPGDDVLISGATGGVGALAIQYAASRAPAPAPRRPSPPAGATTRATWPHRSHRDRAPGRRRRGADRPARRRRAPRVHPRPRPRPPRAIAGGHPVSAALPARTAGGLRVPTSGPTTSPTSPERSPSSPPGPSARSLSPWPRRRRLGGAGGRGTAARLRRR